MKAVAQVIDTNIRSLTFGDINVRRSGHCGPLQFECLSLKAQLTLIFPFLGSAPELSTPLPHLLRS